MSLTVHGAADVARARRLVRQCASQAGLSKPRTEELVLAVSELATNLVSHATGGGDVLCSMYETDGRPAVEVLVRDRGPGIVDVARAMEDQYTTKSGLGSGLPAARRLVDTFEIESATSGTKIRLGKWLAGR